MCSRLKFLLFENEKKLQAMIDRLAFEGKDTEDAFMYATHRFLPNESL